MVSRKQPQKTSTWACRKQPSMWVGVWWSFSIVCGKEKRWLRERERERDKDRDKETERRERNLRGRREVRLRSVILI